MAEQRERPVRVWVDPAGPTYIEGPVELCLDGASSAQLVDRFRVAICACRRSGRYPLCDGSHRRLTDTFHPEN
jgi:CDGSH-type Zn-finger protein